MKVLSAIVVFVWTFVKMIVAGSCAVLLQLFGFVVGTVVKIAELTWGATKFIGCMVLLLLFAGVGWLLLSSFGGAC